MNDIFEFESPLGVLGKIADNLFFEKYITNFLDSKNKVLKDFAESDKWKISLNENGS